MYVIWGRGLGLVTRTGSLALRARACTRLRRDMQMCSVGAIEKAGASVLFWDPLNPWINFTLASRALWDESDQNILIWGLPVGKLARSMAAAAPCIGQPPPWQISHAILHFRVGGARSVSAVHARQGRDAVRRLLTAEQPRRKGRRVLDRTAYIVDKPLEM